MATSEVMEVENGQWQYHHKYYHKYPWDDEALDDNKARFKRENKDFVLPAGGVQANSCTELCLRLK